MQILLNEKYSLKATGVRFGYDQGLIHLSATLDSNPFIADMPLVINNIKILNSQDQVIYEIADVDFNMDQYQYETRSDNPADDYYEQLTGFLELIAVPTLIKDDAV